MCSGARGCAAAVGVVVAANDAAVVEYVWLESTWDGASTDCAWSKRRLPKGTYRAWRRVDERAGRACRTGLTSEARLVGDNVPPAVVCGGKHPEVAVVVEPRGGFKALVDVDDRRLVCEQLTRAFRGCRRDNREVNRPHLHPRRKIVDMSFRKGSGSWCATGACELDDLVLQRGDLDRLVMKHVRMHNPGKT